MNIIIGNVSVTLSPFPLQLATFLTQRIKFNVKDYVSPWSKCHYFLLKQKNLLIPRKEYGLAFEQERQKDKFVLGTVLPRL